MKINPNSNYNAQHMNAKAFPNRQNRNATAERLGIDIGRSIKLDDVELTLSRRAQGMLAPVEGGFEGRVRHFEEFTHPDLEVAQDEWFNRESVRELAALSGFRSDDLMINFFAQLQRSQSVGFSFESDTRNMAALANSYAEIRQSLEATYTGGNLENRLEALSEAFAFSADRLARQSEHIATRRMNVETINRIKQMRREMGITGHMSIELPGGMSATFFTAGPGLDGEVPEELLERLEDYVSTTEQIISSMREANAHFANLARQFVLENGAVSTADDKDLLESFFRAAERPEGSFSFDELSAAHDIVRSNSQGRQNSAMFEELRRLLGRD
ncbi:MAG: hypothetical protein FWB97_02525 [Oscillospiraceae bacterium]|nr:hypothetical protein [Oscillospiraceae bacterium]